jgi:hypothetical protein
MFGYKEEGLIKPPEGGKSQQQQIKVQAGNFIVYAECFISLCVLLYDLNN